MNVYDLFSGHGGWGRAFAQRGHTVHTLDSDPYYQADLVVDIRNVTADRLVRQWGSPDVVLASPPCEAFSVNSVWRNWTPELKPRHQWAQLGKDTVVATVSLIQALEPRLFVVENPRSVLRKMGIVPFEQREVWYCHYGAPHAKPTDLWGQFPRSWRARPTCHNRVASHSWPCCCFDHLKSSRGSHDGVQSLNYDLKSVIPHQLSYTLCRAAERELFGADPGRQKA